MAKRMMAMRSERCTCGPGSVGWMVVAAVVFAVGVWLLLRGIMGQWNNTETPLMILLFYAVALLVFSVGKALKWKAMSCPMHGSHCM